VPDRFGERVEFGTGGRGRFGPEVTGRITVPLGQQVYAKVENCLVAAFPREVRAFVP